MPPAPNAMNAASSGAIAFFTGATILPSPLDTSVTALMAVWNGLGSRVTRSPNSDGMAATTPLAIWPTRGRMFFSAVPMLSLSCWLNALMSALLLPRPASQFCHAAFIEFTDPSMVVAASRAVVPLMPICFWTRLMASTTSLKLSMLRSLPSLSTPGSLLASEMRRCISVFVPP